LKVLVVEEDPRIRAMLSEFLWLRGHQIAAAPDAEEAWDAHSGEPYPFMVVDLDLPGMNGLEFCRRIRSLPDGDTCYLVVLTDKTDPKSLTELIDSGASDYVTTPLNLALLQVRLNVAERHVAEIVRRRAAEDELAHQSYHDALTGLPNRTLLRDRLNQAILAAQRTYEPLALVVMDLDRFADINDTLGHNAGDLVLQQIGQRLQDALRTSDTVARLGGDEFAVVLRAADDQGAKIVADRIQEELDSPFNVGGMELDVNASIGIALYPFHGTDANTLIQRADVAMYLAKQNGSGFAFYTSDRDEHSSSRLALMGDLRRAIERDELVVYYQPKIACATSRVSGAEALVRWRHPEQGLLFPDKFIPLAEQSGLMKPLTLWVLRDVLRQIREWNDQGMFLSVAVNLSARSLQDAELPGEVAEALELAGVDFSALELEITESAVMADPVRALEIVTGLANLGIHLSIDDFGTGYSSMAYLKRLPVRNLKIDKSFVLDMLTNENDGTIVRSIINLGHDLGLNVIAEGVETPEIFERLRQLNCDEAQGYYMSKPISSADFTRFVTESPWGVTTIAPGPPTAEQTQPMILQP